MAETPTGYFPDVKVQWNAQAITDHVTEITVARNLREQRRAVAISTGLRRFTAGSDAVDQGSRTSIRDFLTAHRGKFGAFYFFSPVPALWSDVACGSVAASARFVIPFKTVTTAGVASGTITDVRVAGVTSLFTRRALIPRPTTYAALRLNGSTDHVTCGTSATLRSLVSMSYAMWIYNTGTAPVSLVTNETANASGMTFGLTGAGNLLYFQTSQAGAHTASTGPVIPSATWTHIALVKNANGTPPTFYVNGVATTGTGNITDPIVATAAFRISNGADAMLQDVRAYNFSWTGTEILNIYNGVATPVTNLVGWWKLTDGTGTVATDSSGYANTGTLTNSPVWVAGEEEITFSGGALTGAVTMTGTARERIVARFDSDSIAQSFLANAGDVRAIFNLAIKEVIP